MVNFKVILAKNLILLLIILVFAGLFSLVLADNVQAAYGLGQRVKQVKTADDPMVYYLDHKLGFKKAYVSAKAYLSYGNKWSDIKIVSQAELDKWPDLTLVKTKNSNRVYYIYQGQKALIEDEQQFIDYGFAWSGVATVAEKDLAEYKLTDFDKIKVSSLSKTVGAADNAAGAQAAGLLKINLLPTGQTSFYLPTGSRGNVVAAFKLSAVGADAKITNLTFSQQGVSSDEIIEAVYLTDETNFIYGDRYGLTNKRLYLNLISQPLIIPAGQSKIFYLKADLKSVSGVTGQTLKFGLINPLDVAVNSRLSAAWPLLGPEFRLADGVRNLGKVKISALTLTVGDAVGVGVNSKAVAAFRIAEDSGNEDVLIKKIVLTNIGSAQDGDLRNLVLIDQAGQLVMKVQVMADQKATFILEPGYLIKKKHYATFTLKTDVLSGDGRDLKFIINNDSDVLAVSRDNGYSLAVVNESASGNANRYRIARNPVFLTASSLKASELLIYRDQPEAVLGAFELRNNISDIKLTSFTLSIVKSSGAPALDQPLAVFDSDSGAVLGTIDAQKITNNFGEINLSNLQAAKGKTLKIKFKTHVPDTAQSGDNYLVFVKSVNYRIPENNIVYSDQVELSGQKMQVIKPTLYLYSGKLEKDDLAVAGDQQVYLGFFKVEATNEEHIRITGLTVANAAGFTPVNYSSGFTNLALYKNGYRVSDYIAQPNANSYTFEDLNVYVGAGTSADLYVRADAAANAAGKVKLVLENAVVEDYVSKIPGEVINKNVASPEVALSQTVLAIKSLNGGTAVRAQRTNQIASFSLTNKSAEKVRINNITLNSSGFLGNLSSNNGFRNLRFGYVDNRDRVVSIGSWVSKPVADVNEISLGSFTYDPGETFTINLYVDAAEDAVTGSISLFIRDIQARGVLSGVDASVSGLPTDAVKVEVRGEIIIMQ